MLINIMLRNNINYNLILKKIIINNFINKYIIFSWAKMRVKILINYNKHNYNKQVKLKLNIFNKII